MSRFASGVTVVTAARGDQRFGMTVSSFVSVSIEPPLVLVCIAKNLQTHAAIEETRAFAVNILGIHQLDLALRFAGMKPELSHRFVGLSCSTGLTGAPLIDDSIASLDCRLQAIHDGGDHAIFVGEVVAAHISRDEPALLYHNRLWQRAVTIEPPTAPRELP